MVKKVMQIKPAKTIKHSTKTKVKVTKGTINSAATNSTATEVQKSKDRHRKG